VAKTLRLTVMTPAETLREVEDAAWVHLRLADGTGLTVYPGHMPLLAETIRAPIRYAEGADEHTLNAEAGILRVDGGAVTVFTSGEAELEASVPAPASSEERKFERLAQELRESLGREDDPTLRHVFDLGADREAA